MPKKAFPYNIYWTAFASWFFVLPFVHFFLLEHYGIATPTALTDSVISTLLLAGACLDVKFILRFFRSQKKAWYMPLVWSAGLSAILLIILNFIINWIYAGDKTGYLLFFEYTIPIRFIISFLIIVIFELIDRIMYYVSHQMEDEKRKMDIEKLGKDAELATLRQQLQPHFLFNTLNSVSALVTLNQEEARNMIQRLSDFLRGTIKKDEKQLVNFASELKQVQLYLDIEKVRFGNRLNTSLEYNDFCLDLAIPPLLIQPLVENAIKFGLYDTMEDVTIQIKAKAENGYLLIRISNPFDSATAKPHNGTGFGISSVQRRLYLLFARNDLLDTRTVDNLFTVTVKIPQHT